GDFEGQPVRAEEAKAVAAAEALKAPGLEDDLAPGGGHPFEQGVDIGPAVGGEGDHVDPLLRVLAQTHHEQLIVTRGGQVDQAVVLGDFPQAPLVAVKGPFQLKIGDGVADVADLGDTAHDGSCCRSDGRLSDWADPQIGSATTSIMAFVASACSTRGALPS